MKSNNNKYHGNMQVKIDQNHNQYTGHIYIDKKKINFIYCIDEIIIMAFNIRVFLIVI